jgi:hypothetical protein
MARAVLVLAIGLMMLAALPAGAVIFVDQNACGMGDNGSSWTDAFRSIQRGIDLAAASDDKEVWVADGVYAETITLRDGVAVYGGFSGCSEGEEMDRALRNPTAFQAVIDAGGAAHAVIIQGVKGVTLDGFVVRNASDGGVDCTGSAGVVISGNEITTNQVQGEASLAHVIPNAAGVACWGSKVRILRNRIVHNRAPLSDQHPAALLFEESEGEIVANTIAHNGGYVAGIQCVESSPAIVGNLIADNNGYLASALWIDAHSRPRLVNNTIVANTTEGANGIGGVVLLNDEALVTNCILWGNGVDLKGGAAKHCIIQNGGPDEGNLRADPMFVNSAKGDYRLKPGSPAIDAGDTAALDAAKYPTDLAGNPRVCDGDGKGGAQVDIGAYEYCPKGK